ncbi:MAG: trigger factor [Deltaproteobacteria bacterium]|nr:MAG: trigger factor [Deltaproteobacteria bacterium]
MKTNVEEISPVKKKLVVEIDSTEVDNMLQAAYKKVGKKAKIPGFRPGKAPKKILERYFGEQVHEDVTRDIISDTFPKALQETDMIPLGTPLLEKETLTAGKAFTYSAIMEVRPEIQVADYLELEIEKEEAAVSDEKVRDRLEQIRKAHGKLNALEEDRPVKDGDYAVLEYEAFEDGSPIEGIKANNFMLHVGSGDFNTDFESALIGLKKGDKGEVDVDFEETYYHEKLAGKKVHFTFQIHDVKEMVLPELDDEFAKNFGEEFQDIKTLENRVREMVTAEEEKRVETDLKRRLIQKIAEKTEFDLPEVLVNAEIDNALNRVRENLMRSGSSLEKAGLSEEKLRQDFREDAEKRVKEMLILGEIANREDIGVNDEELAEGIAGIAQSMGQPVESIKQYYEARGLMDSLRETLMEEKTLNYLVEHAKIISKQSDNEKPDTQSDELKETS